MKKLIYIGFLIVFLAIIVMAYLLYSKNLREQNISMNDFSDKVVVENIQPGDTIESPVEIIGKARGYWFFEADFPVFLQDADGQNLAWAIAQAQDDWMTEEFVPFKAVLEFEKPATETGYLVLEKDNPSGLPENAGSISMPVKFGF